MHPFLLVSTITLALLPAALTGCSKKDESKAAQEANPTPAEVAPETEAEAAPNAPILIIKAAKLSFEAGENNTKGPITLELKDNGDLVANGEGKGKVTADGKIVDENGKELASIAADGRMSFLGLGAESRFVIDAGGSLRTDGEVSARFGEDNVLITPGTESSDKFTFEGPDEAKRVMMAIVMVLMTDGQWIHQEEL